MKELLNLKKNQIVIEVIIDRWNMYKSKLKNNFLYWISMLLFVSLAFFIPVYYYATKYEFSQTTMLSIIASIAVIYFVTLIVLNIYHWTIKNEITLSLLIINSIFCMISMVTSFFCIIIMICCRKKLKWNEQIQFKLSYDKKEKCKLNTISWTVLSLTLLIVLLNAIPFTYKIFFGNQYGFISAFVLVQFSILLATNLIVHITYICLCSKTYKTKNTLRWKILDLVTFGYVWSNKYTIPNV